MDLRSILRDIHGLTLQLLILLVPYKMDMILNIQMGILTSINGQTLGLEPKALIRFHMRLRKKMEKFLPLDSFRILLSLEIRSIENKILMLDSSIIR